MIYCEQSVMECNKDEALRAKELAEKKMESNDFEGAKKVALKAESLYPNLENIPHLLAVCTVHCSAQNSSVGSEKDWYGILQIDKMADELTIKKQYRKLALLLHPDKNKLPGAEAAFKLIGEANVVLSDPSKRSLYDSKHRGFSRGAVARRPPHQFNRNPPVRPNIIPNAFNAPFSNLNHHQHTQPTSSAAQETFWTQCPFCHIRYQYYKNFVNKVLRCQKCLKPFTAYDLGSQAAPPGNWNHPGGQDVPLKSNQGTSKMAAGNSGVSPTQMGYQQGLNSRTAGSEPELCRGKTAPVFEDIRTKVKDKKHGKPMGNMEEGAAMPKVDHTRRKRGRKQIVESSESYDTSSTDDTEDVDIENESYPPAGQRSELDGNSPRRSSRQRQRVSYNEVVSDDENDLSRPLKKARANQSAGGSTFQQTDAEGVDDLKHTGPSSFHSYSGGNISQNGMAPHEGNLQENSSNIGTVNKQAAKSPSSGVKKIEVIVDADSEPDTNPDDNPPETYDYPDPEFNDFDKHKEENCFAADQIWACYDSTDGMPRFHARIRKVLSPGFKISFVWLEPCAEDRRSKSWLKAGLPVGCGKLRQGQPHLTSDRLTFSHQVQCKKERGLYIVHPMKGETWALFKDWDISWSFKPDIHREYKYVLVEVLSDYVGDVGVQVSYLDKVSGFVSLFQQTRLTEFDPFFVKPNELYKFSHRIPSFKMTGTEGEGVPVGSFELDPASLPLNPDDIWYPGKVNEDSRTANSEPGENVSSAVHPAMSENVATPLKFVDMTGIDDTDGELSKVRRSPRGVNISEKKQSKINSFFPANGSSASDLDGNGVKGMDRSSSCQPSHLSCQSDEEIPSHTKSCGLTNDAGSSKNPITLSDDKGFQEVFCDFKRDRFVGKFQVDQVWALYDQNSTLPKIYVQIRKIVPVPFKLHVVPLEVCSRPKNAAQLVCGTFKVQNEKPEVCAPSSFSHVVKAVSISKNKFEIYPRDGEIWSLYKNWNQSGFNPDKCEYDIVEVIEYSKDQIKVSSLVRVHGFKSVFMSTRKQKSNSVILEIQKSEFGRFSHQIPAFQLTGEKEGVLRGCWELDPASVPYSL